jgi:hypothetical protein
MMEMDAYSQLHLCNARYRYINPLVYWYIEVHAQQRHCTCPDRHCHGRYHYKGYIKKVFPPLHVQSVDYIPP